MLAIKEISKKYSDSTGVFSVDFTINPGECVALIGANGAGKSTLMKLILGLIPKDSGQIHFFGGKTIEVLRAAIMNRIGYVSSEFWLEPQYTVDEYLQLFSQLYLYHDEQVARDLMVRLQLKPEQKVASLSRGQNVRLQFLLALSHRPDLLILDEATTGLDVAARQDVLSLLSEFQSEGNTSILMATHHPDEVARLAQRVVFIRQGRVQKDLDTEGLLARSYLSASIPTEGEQYLFGKGGQGQYVCLAPESSEPMGTLATMDEICHAFCAESKEQA